jgi:hypothetical protein
MLGQVQMVGMHAVDGPGDLGGVAKVKMNRNPLPGKGSQRRAES